MNKELIERMKNNRVQTFLLSDEEYQILIDVGLENLEYHYKKDSWCRVNNIVDRYSNLIIRIKADYQPEAEQDIEKVEVDTNREVLVYNREASVKALSCFRQLTI